MMRHSAAVAWMVFLGVVVLALTLSSIAAL